MIKIKCMHCGQPNIISSKAYELANKTKKNISIKCKKCKKEMFELMPYTDKERETWTKKELGDKFKNLEKGFINDITLDIFKGF